MRFLDAVDRAIIVEDYFCLFYIAGDLGDQPGLHAEVILKTRTAAGRELHNVCRFGSEITERHDAREHVELFEIDEMRGVERCAQFCGGTFWTSQSAQVIIETEFPRGPCVGGGDYLTVAERELPTFRRRRVFLRGGSADWLIVELNGPVVGCVFERANRLLPAERLEIVANDLLSRREFFLCRRLLGNAGQQQYNKEKSNDYAQELLLLLHTRASRYDCSAPVVFGFPF